MSGARTWFGRGLDQDWVDSANGFWTVLLLAVCSVGALLARFVSQPISCFTPSTFTTQHAAYAKSTCFADEIFYIPQNTSFFDKEDTEPSTSYHLWIPLILFVQALCFKIPNIIWNIVKPNVTFNLEATVTSLEYAQVANVETRQAVIRQAGNVIAGLLQRNRFILGILYLFAKLLFFLNLCGQFVFLTIYFRQFLAIETSDYLGFDISSHLKPLLQKTVLCDFFVQSPGNKYEFTVQCQLPVVEIYEKLFVFLWYWVFLLTVVTLFNLLLWAGFLFLPFLRDSRISTYIKTSGSTHDPSVSSRFISGFLGIDGVLLLSMISRNSSEMVAADLCKQLHQVFLERKRSGSISSDLEMGDQLHSKATSSGKQEGTAADNDVPEVQVSPEKGVAMEELSSPTADTSSTNLLDQGGANEDRA